MRRRIAAAWVLGAAVVAGVPPVPATSFDPAARLRDRRVELEWAPEADDPLFTGNLRVYPVGADTLGEGSADLTQLLFDQFGETLWLLGGRGELVTSLTQDADGEWGPGATLPPLPEGVEVTGAALHPAGHLLVAGLRDGRIAVWRPGIWEQPEMIDIGAGACRGVAFRPLAVPADSSFATVTESGLLTLWAAPGRVLADTLIDPAGLWSVAFDREGKMVALGGGDGAVEIWQALGGASRLRRFVGPTGRAVNRLAWSQDGRRCASADTLGTVRLWDVFKSSELGAYTPDVVGPVWIAFTPKESDFIGYARRDGQLGVLDGRSCQPFNVERYLTDDQGQARGVTGYALTPDGQIGFFGGAAGVLEWWHQGQCVPSANPASQECFGGYIVWRGLEPDPDRLVLLRRYEYGDTTWQWQDADAHRAFVDPDSVIARGGDEDLAVPGPFNGIPYYYSITKYYRRYLDGEEHEVYVNSKWDGLYRTDPAGEPVPLVPRVDAREEPPLLGDLYVVPDPYREDNPDARFGPFSPPMICFFHLPAEATIRVYTTSGELVRTLRHAQLDRGGATCWDLKNEYGRDVTSGVYLYSAEATGGERRTGFLTIVR
jgi:hypothetical protein